MQTAWAAKGLQSTSLKFILVCISFIIYACSQSEHTSGVPTCESKSSCRLSVLSLQILRHLTGPLYRLDEQICCDSSGIEFLNFDQGTSQTPGRSGFAKPQDMNHVALAHLALRLQCET